MVCHPGNICTQVLDKEAYGQLGFGGLTFWERSRQKVECLTCHVGLAQQSSLRRRHMEQTRHGQETLNMATPDPTEMGLVVYRGHLPKTDCVMGRGAACPVPAGCGYTAAAWGGLRAHFQFRHPEDSDTRKTQSTYSTNCCGHLKSVRVVALS